MTKVSIHQENIIILSVYIAYNKASNYRKQKLTELQGKIDKFIIIFEEFNNPSQ